MSKDIRDQKTAPTQAEEIVPIEKPIISEADEKDGIEQILKKLEQIEQKVKKDSLIVLVGLPVLLAIIAAISSHTTSMRQTRLNNQLQSEVAAAQTKMAGEINSQLADHNARLTILIESQKHVQEARAKYYRDVKEALAGLDEAFEELTQFEHRKKFDKLTAALDRMKKLYQSSPPLTRKELPKALKNYSKFIANKWIDFDKDPNDELRRAGYEESKALLEECLAELDKLIEPPKPLDE
jgi:hypothetical protein